MHNFQIGPCAHLVHAGPHAQVPLHRPHYTSPVRQVPCAGPITQPFSHNSSYAAPCAQVLTYTVPAHRSPCRAYLTQASCLFSRVSYTRHGPHAQVRAHRSHCTGLFIQVPLAIFLRRSSHGVLQKSSHTGPCAQVCFCTALLRRSPRTGPCQHVPIHGSLCAAPYAQAGQYFDL